MHERIDKELDRRRESRRQSYFYVVGSIIRQARLALGMTQALLAHGICSNTYISKIENSQIEPNWETVFRIAEKAHVYPYVMEIPRRMLDNLSESLDYFLWFDQASYQAFLDKMTGYDFGVALDIMKFGNALLTGDRKEAKQIYEYGHHFFRNMDDFGFSLFLLFSSEYLIQTHDYVAARTMLDRVEQNERFFLLCPELYHELRFVSYSRLGDTVRAARHYDAAKALYVVKENDRRIARLAFLKEAFDALQSDAPLTALPEASDVFLSERQFDEWLLEFALQCNPAAIDRIASWKDDHPLKADALLAAIEADPAGSDGKAANALQAHADLHPEAPDYGSMLEARRIGDKALEREKVVSLMIARAHRLQSVSELKRWYQKAADLSFRMKRYKDAAKYLAKLQDLLGEYRGTNRPQSAQKENRPLDEADDDTEL